MIAPNTLLISGGRIIDPSQGIDLVGDLLISEGKIASVGGAATAPDGCPILRAQGLVVAPGFIDLHCHLREPGFEDKETIATGTRAAAKGGFTTICCMPNTEPSIDTQATVEYVIKTARESGVVRVLPIGCISKGRKGKELAEMGELAQAGVVGFSDDGSPVADSRLMRHALEYSRAFGLPVIDHCEDLALTEEGTLNEGWVAIRLGLRGMPDAAEEIVVARDLALAELTGARLHIAHVSTAGSVELIRRAKAKSIVVTAEATPHHLTMTDEWVMGRRGSPDSSDSFGVPLRDIGGSITYDTNAKVNPPLRTNGDIQALRDGLRDGTIDAIATDHAPHTIVDKLCEFGLAAFGISGLETALGSLMALVHSGHLDLSLLISKLTVEPARIIKRDGLPPDLGTLKIGAPGDVTLFDANLEWEVNPDAFLSKGKNTPLAGRVLKGKVMATVVGGDLAYRDKAIVM